MRYILAPLAIALAAPIAHASDLRWTSRVDAVTVFPSGAEVTRTAKVQMDKGDHVIILSDLPAEAIANSIRVEGKSAGRLEIGSVDALRLAVPRTDARLTESERRRLEGEIERLQDELALVQAEVQAAELQKAFLTNLTQLPGASPAGAHQHGAAAQPDWGQLVALVGARMVEAQRALLQAGLKARDVERKIKDVQGQLAAIAPAEQQRTEVKVHVTAAAQLDADLTVRYQVPNASWTPFYDARLATGSKGAAAKLLLVRRASIQQRSGETWDDVALTLSTTRPAGGTAAPVLHPWTVDFEPDVPPPPARPLASAPAGRAAPMAGGMSEERDAMKARAALPASEPVTERRSGVELAPFQALYTVPGRVTIAPASEAKRVQIDESALEPALVVRAVPKVDEKAYVYAKLKLPKGAPYLAGMVALFRDATFVGNGRLPLLSGGDEHELGFGVDDAIKVRYTIAEEKRSESGIISSSKVDNRNFRIIVKSLHTQAMPVTIMDQIPVAQHQDIRVDLTAKPQPSRQNVDDKRGVLAWDMTLAADEEKVIELGYRLTWPAAKNVLLKR